MKNGNASTPRSNAPGPEGSDAYRNLVSGNGPLVKNKLDIKNDVKKNIQENIIEDQRNALQAGFYKDKVSGNTAQINHRTNKSPNKAFA